MHTRSKYFIYIVGFILLSSTTISISGQQQSRFRTHFPSSQVKCDASKSVEKTIFWSYGAVYLANGLRFPGKCFLSESDVIAYQNSLRSENQIKSITALPTFFLQNSAADSLNTVFSQLSTYFRNTTTKTAKAEKRRVKWALKSQRNESEDIQYWVPRECNHDERLNPAGCFPKGIINNDWVTRTYDQVLGNWNGRVKSDLKIEASLTDAEIREKITRAISLNASLPFSAAIPGSSQHILLAAIDVNRIVCAPGSICEKRLMKNGWFRTVLRDKDHFTFLGIRQDRLTALGLQRRYVDGYIYFIPKR